MISQSTIDRIKDVDIHTVVSHYVDLKKAGKDYRGLSPFNEEKTPSFYVVPAKQIFKDFSSGKGGGAIHFVMELTGKTFPEAIEEIASIAGERVEYEEKATPEQKEQADRRELLYKVNEAAAKRFASQLTGVLDKRAAALIELDGQPAFTHPAIDEILKRRFTCDTIAQWCLGYAPDEWQFITDLVGTKSRAEAMDLGLIKEKDGRTYDHFRNRFMFPIHDHHGRIVAFGGRAMKQDEHNPKYLNSSESPVYAKQKTLFGLHFAGAAIRKAGHVNVMEGFCDVISMHQAGLINSVGTCGTALSEEQCKLLRKYTDKAVLFYDGDEAGQRATLSAIDLLVQHGFQTGVVPMPEGIKDPDELVRYYKQVA